MAVRVCMVSSLCFRSVGSPQGLTVPTNQISPCLLPAAATAADASRRADDDAKRVQRTSRVQWSSEDAPCSLPCSTRGTCVRRIARTDHSSRPHLWSGTHIPTAWLLGRGSGSCNDVLTPVLRGDVCSCVCVMDSALDCNAGSIGGSCRHHPGGTTALPRPASSLCLVTCFC